MNAPKKFFDDCSLEDYKLIVGVIFGKVEFYVDKFQRGYFIVFRPEDEQSPIEPVVIWFNIKNSNMCISYLKPDGEKISVFTDGTIPKELTDKFYIE